MQGRTAFLQPPVPLKLLTAVPWSGRLCLMLWQLVSMAAHPSPCVDEARARKWWHFVWYSVSDCCDLVNAGSSRWQLPLAEEDWKDAKAQASASVLEWYHQLPHVGSCCLLRLLLWSGGKMTFIVSPRVMLQNCACAVSSPVSPLSAVVITAHIFQRAIAFCICHDMSSGCKICPHKLGCGAQKLHPFPSGWSVLAGTKRSIDRCTRWRRTC